MAIKVDDFIELLGREAGDEQVKDMLSRLNQMAPVLNKGKDIAWFELEDEGFDLGFEDESLINNDEYADVGDGELIFMAAYFNDPSNIILPFDIGSKDTYEDIVSKIGRIEDRDNKPLSKKIWLFKTDEELSYTLFFSFDDDYSEIWKLGVVYSYGQLKWVEELKRNQ